MPYDRILFLDIDGVVLPNRAMFLPNQTKPILETFDPCSVSLLNRACHERKYKIVIHSSWLRFFGEQETLRHCIEQGIVKGHFHETDPFCSSKFHWRYDRIDDWLSRHSEVTYKYWVLDDVAPEPGWPRDIHWINCDEDEGITLKIFKQLTKEKFAY